MSGGEIFLLTDLNHDETGPFVSRADGEFDGGVLQEVEPPVFLYVVLEHHSPLHCNLAIQLQENMFLEL